MYPNLEAEMARKKVTRDALAKKLGKTPTTLGKKLNGSVPLTLPECIRIKEILKLDLDIEFLFAKQPLEVPHT